MTNYRICGQIGIDEYSALRDYKDKQPICTLALSLLTMMIVSLIGTQAEAGLMLDFSEIGGNVRLDYQGTLDLTGMVHNPTSTVDEHDIRFVTPPLGAFSNFTAIINVYFSPTAGNQQVRDMRQYSNPFTSAPLNYISNTTPAASSFGGNALLLPTKSIATTASLVLAEADFAGGGNVWTGVGFMQWNNTTLATLGIDASPKTWVLTNGQTISAGVTAVPEPSSLLLWGAGIIPLAVMRRFRNPIQS